MLKADWATPASVKAQFGTASILKVGRVVFNLAGNKSRLVVWINHPCRVVDIRCIGTHLQDDAIDAQTIRPCEGMASMDVKPVRTEADHRAALKAVESLMGANARASEGDRLDVLVTLIEGCARQHFPVDLPDAVEAIKFRMEQQGLTPKDLEPHAGRSNRVDEVLNRRRGLTLGMIQKLHAGLGIPAECLRKQTVRVPAAR